MTKTNFPRWAKRKLDCSENIGLSARSFFDRVGTGPALRHRQTAQPVGEEYRKAGRDFPSPCVMDEFDEFQGDAVLSQSLPELVANNDRIRELHGALQNSGAEAKRATFQRLFQAVIPLWVSGEIAPPGVEPWQDFCTRANRGLSEFLEKSRKGEIAAIFTSGGPVSVAVQRALHLSAQDTLQIAWMPRNSSFSEFLFSGDRFMLRSFNSFPHLESDSLLSYR